MGDLLNGRRGSQQSPHYYMPRTACGRLYAYGNIPESGHTLSGNQTSVWPALAMLNLGLLRYL